MSVVLKTLSLGFYRTFSIEPSGGFNRTPISGYHFKAPSSSQEGHELPTPGGLLRHRHMVNLTAEGFRETTPIATCLALVLSLSWLGKDQKGFHKRGIHDQGDF